MYLKNTRVNTALVFSLVLLFVLASHSMAAAKPYITSSLNKVVNATENDKNWLGTDYYFIYKLNQRPQIGTIILKVQIFDKNDHKVTPFKLTGFKSMSTMGGMQDAGAQTFQMNKKNDYLLPIDLVMPGDWQTKLVFYKGKTEYARAKINLHI